MAAFAKSRWEGALWAALAGALPPCVITLWESCWWDALLGQPFCSSKGAPAPCWALPIPQSILRTTRQVPSALEESGAAGGLGSVAAWAAAIPRPTAVPAGARSGVRGAGGGSRLPSCCFTAFRRGCGWERGGMNVAGLGVTGSAKQGQRGGGYQGGTARVEPHLMLPAPKSEVIFTPPHKRRVLYVFCLTKTAVSEAFGVSLKASLGEVVSRPGPTVAAPKPAPSAGASRRWLDLGHLKT